MNEFVMKSTIRELVRSGLIVGEAVLVLVDSGALSRRPTSRVDWKEEVDGRIREVWLHEFKTDPTAPKKRKAEFCKLCQKLSCTVAAANCHWNKISKTHTSKKK